MKNSSLVQAKLSPLQYCNEVYSNYLGLKTYFQENLFLMLHLHIFLWCLLSHTTRFTTCCVHMYSVILKEKIRVCLFVPAGVITYEQTCWHSSMLTRGNIFLINNQQCTGEKNNSKKTHNVSW